MNIYRSLIIGSILFLPSCAAQLSSSLHKKYAPLDYKEEVRVFTIDEKIPPNAERLGSIDVGDSGFSVDCSFDTVLEKAKTEARKAGGNILRIMKHKKPDFWSTCHRITVDVFKVENTEHYEKK